MNNIDPYFCIFDSIGYPKNYKKIEFPSGFSVYLLCNTLDKRYIFVHTDRMEFNLSSARDNQDVIRLFNTLSKRLSECEKANDLFDYYDSSELHEAHRAKFEGNDVPVFRIRKASLRLYLVFFGSHVVLFRLATKRQDKINDSEKNTLDQRVKAIYTYPVGSKEFLRRVL